MKKSIKSRLFKGLSILSPLFTKTGLAILTYHTIDESGSVISASLVDFKRQMDYLKDNNYIIFSLEEAVFHIKNKIKFPKKAIAITFDDGYKNNYLLAYPILKQYNFKATIFLTTDYIGNRNAWPYQNKPYPNLEMLSWEEIIEMSNNGIDFGAHTQSHPFLTKISSEKAQQQIINSKKIIEGYINKPVKLFSYPFGDFNSDVMKIVRDNGFIGACSSLFGRVGLKSNIYSLERIDMGYVFDLTSFKVLISSKPFFYHVLRWERKL
ncbi:MAG: polysaccharide deacetylase family protein [Candidatus Omnitrophota bacterium]|nr:polysaccharide deacetylase family protein [Candidatus Omnitrophota bacterium]